MKNNLSMSYLLQQASLAQNLIRKADLKLGLHGISFTEFLIMHHLRSAPELTLRRIDLAESVGITASGITRLLAPMEKIHLVEKQANPRDARVSLVKLTEAGSQLHEDATQSLGFYAEQLCQNLTVKELKQLMKLNQQINVT